MGCQWSDQNSPGFSTLGAGMELDPVEEHLHIKAWKDPMMRCRKMVDSNGDIEIEVSKKLRESIMWSTPGEQQPAAADAASPPRVDLPAAAPGGDLPTVKEEEEETKPAGVRDDEAAGENGVRERLAALEREQDMTRKKEMLKVDPACWRGYAEQGYFQKAEDLLHAAFEAEAEFVGKTTRYARLKYALGELYDHRSNIDITGQQQALSFKSALYAQSAVSVLEEEGSRVEDKDADERKDLLAMSLLLRGRSLCNFALDGDSDEMSARQAFEVAEGDLMRCVEMMEGKGSHKLARANMSIGYLHYCKAGCIMNMDNSSMNEVMKTPEDSFKCYSKAEEYYNNSLTFSIESSGESSEDSIRMMCNLALVKNSMSKLPLPTSADNLLEAKMWYQNALDLQTAAFGKRHDRTLRIQEDLSDILEREKVLNGEVEAKAPRSQLKDEEREREADALMEEFLKARRQERQQEQTSLVQDKKTKEANGADRENDDMSSELPIL